MTDELIMQLGQETLKTAALLSAPILITALVVGLVISVLQAITQINEATLTFIPKIIIVAVVIVITGPWMLDIMSRFTINLLENITDYVR
ncbi:MAG: flagellar biosynthesis protein FliQ [Bdellovibrionota bacterium]